ncbi:MAG TPA: hypothetical protein VES95_07075 [Dermatophilaceae bacterium]|nr:hypothetical protein [Dermatophilaceae bacterium]
MEPDFDGLWTAVYGIEAVSRDRINQDHDEWEFLAAQATSVRLLLELEMPSPPPHLLEVPGLEESLEQLGEELGGRAAVPVDIARHAGTLLRTGRTLVGNP